jgi:hypothetical protein
MADNIVAGRVSAPAQLRKLTQPIYDTNILQNGAATALTQFFRLPVGNLMPVTAVAKTLADTNMTAAGYIGNPEHFDLESFNFEYFIHDPTNVGPVVADSILLYQQSVFTFFFGVNRPWLRVPLSQIPNGVALTGTFADGDVTANTAAMWTHLGRARVDSVYEFTVAGQSIAIRPNESFQVDLTWPNGAVTWTAASSRARVYLNGSFYAAL